MSAAVFIQDAPNIHNTLAVMTSRRHQIANQMDESLDAGVSQQAGEFDSWKRTFPLQAVLKKKDSLLAQDPRLQRLYTAHCSQEVSAHWL